MTDGDARPSSGREDGNGASEGAAPGIASAETPNRAESGGGSVGRYSMESRGSHYAVRCANSPNVEVDVRAGAVFSRRDMHSYGDRTVFLDGACAGAPFLDNRRKRYSLDHHEGCVREFTLAACEQAAVMVLRGLPLEEGDWKVVVNGLDLDSALAAWVLINYAELRADDAALLSAAMPYIRLEGAIDAHGLEGIALALLPGDEGRAIRSRVEGLAKLARVSPSAGSEETARVLLDVLDAIDEALLPERTVAELADHAVSARATLAGGKLAVACKSSSGIYEVEEYFRARYGNSLGIIVLDKGEGHYTVKIVDKFFGDDLSKVYKRLNRRDAFSRQGNQWGGSASIGGSPRETGSALDAREVLEEIGKAYDGGFVANFLSRLLSS